MIKYILVALSFCLLSCAGQKIEDFRHNTHTLKIESFFLGKTLGTGVFFDRFGRLKRSFVVKMTGEQIGEKIQLKELLKYDDGEIVKRTYNITKINKDHYQATAEGLVGPASIQASGNALQWKYRLKQKIGDSEWTLSFDDWMYLQPTGIVLNRAKVSKFGLNVGEVLMAIQRVQ